MKSIVLATDGSPSARHAIDLAVELAHGTGAKLWVVAAWEGILTVYPYTSAGPVPEVEDAERHRAVEAAAAATQQAEAEGVETETVVREGRPADIVSETAAAVGASLIVVGSHGWGALRRLAFGSVSRALLHEAPCPVLVARYEPAHIEPTAAKREEVAV